MTRTLKFFLFMLIVLYVYLSTITITKNTNDEKLKKYSTKYFLTLCLIVKNERYLDEFIAFYDILGVEHIYIYDNGSKPSVEETLLNKYFKNKITVINFPGKIVQLKAYNDCLNIHGNKTTWMVVVDSDEYIFPQKTRTLNEFLHSYDDAHAIGIHWVVYGSSFHDKIQKGFLL